MLNSLADALAHDHQQRLRAEAARYHRARRAPSPARRTVGLVLIRIGNRLARPQPVRVSAAR